jgi:hypothetical protein
MASPNSVDTGLVDKPAAPSSPTPLDAVRSPKLPPPESSESIWLRRFAILSFWAVVLFLGLPIWLKTTAIYRAELPLQEMTEWAEGKVRAVDICPYLMLMQRRCASQSSLYASPSKLQFRPRMPNS